MPGSLPGAAGVAVFVGIKFAGYWMAGEVLKKEVPAIRASALKIAVARTVLGVLLGPLITLAWIWLFGRRSRVIRGSIRATYYMHYWRALAS